MPQHLKCLATVIYDVPLITIPVSNCHLSKTTDNGSVCSLTLIFNVYQSGRNLARENEHGVDRIFEIQHSSVAPSTVATQSDSRTRVHNRKRPSIQHRQNRC